MRAFLAALSVAFLLSFPALSANGVSRSPPPCFKSGEFKKFLKTEYGEYPAVSGMVNGFAVVVYANDEKRTWTIVRFAPNGIACMVAAGVEFNRFPKPKPKPKGKPA